MRISDWSSDVCSSDLAGGRQRRAASGRRFGGWPGDLRSKLGASPFALEGARERDRNSGCQAPLFRSRHMRLSRFFITRPIFAAVIAIRSEEHTSELQSLMRISYAVFCLKKKTKTQTHRYDKQH